MRIRLGRADRGKARRPHRMQPLGRVIEVLLERRASRAFDGSLRQKMREAQRRRDLEFREHRGRKGNDRIDERVRCARAIFGRACRR
jgi:hypothetical protein